MAAGIAIGAIKTATTEEFAGREMEAAAQEFSSVVQAHRSQIFRFLLASTRDVDLAEPFEDPGGHVGVEQRLTRRHATNGVDEISAQRSATEEPDGVR